MVVDDDDTFRKLMSEVLRRRYLVLPAENGFDALAKAREIRPDLILLDLSMPGKNGLDTLRRIRQTPELTSLPVIIVTADNRRETVLAMLNAGANDYILKSSVTTDREQLFTKLHRMLDQQNLPSST